MSTTTLTRIGPDTGARAGPGALDAPTRFQTVEPGHRDVQENQIRADPPQGVERLRSRGRRAELVSLRAQKSRQRPNVGRRVVPTNGRLRSLVGLPLCRLRPPGRTAGSLARSTGRRYVISATLDFIRPPPRRPRRRRRPLSRRPLLERLEGRLAPAAVAILLDRAGTVVASRQGVLTAEELFGDLAKLTPTADPGTPGGQASRAA